MLEERIDRARGTEVKHSLLFRSIRGWSRADLGGDVFAGLTLSAIAIPEQMATARLGDLSPQAGFLAFLSGCLAFAVFGTSRHMSVGADSTITPIFAAGLVLLAASGSPHYAALAAVLALMVGATLILAGLLRLGWIADLLSVPVMAGFLAGIAIHIVISQLPDLLGLPAGSSSVFHRFSEVYGSLGAVNPYSTGIGIAVFAIVMACERISARIPGALVALAAATLAVAAFDLPARGVAVLGALPATVPGLHLPTVTFEDVRTLVPLTLLIAVVVMVQTAATTRSFAGAKASGADDVNRDFVGVGAGSLLCGLVGAFPVNASPPRTAIAVETGGRSQVAGLLAAAIVLALMLFGAGLLKNVPQAALAGILFFVAVRILRWQTFAGTLRQAPTEFLLIAATALAIVALPIEVGVAIGIGLSLLHGIWGITQARAIEFDHVPGTSIWWPPDGKPAGERIDGVLVAAFQAPLSFVNANRFGQDFRTMVATRSGLKHVVFEASSVIDIDYTAAQTLREVIAYCHGAGVSFSIARLESVKAQKALVRFGITAMLGSARVFRSVDDAVRALTGAGDAAPLASASSEG